MAKNWYILHTYAGYENNIEKTINTLLASGELDSSIVCSVKVPEEEVVEIKDGKNVPAKQKFFQVILCLNLTCLI